MRSFYKFGNQWEKFLAMEISINFSKPWKSCTFPLPMLGKQRARGARPARARCAMAMTAMGIARRSHIRAGW